MPTTFQILQNDEVVPGLTFTDGGAAATFVKASPGAGYRINKIVTLDIEAELRKFEDGTYRQTPWHNSSWYQRKHRDHLCRVSRVDNSMVEYVDPKSKAVVAARPGRYLTAFFSSYLYADDIELLTQQLGLPEATLHTVSTADEIEDIYVRGPSSCMSYRADNFNTPFHPVRIYEGPDLQLAYITTDNEPDGMVVGRVLIWPEKKTYGRIFSGARGGNGSYSNNRSYEVQVLDALARQGYKASPGLYGARLQRHEHGRGFICPYIDVQQAVDDDGEYLTIGVDISADNTDGVSGDPDDDEPETTFCEHCENHQRDDDYSFRDVYINNGGRSELWCSDCYDGSDAFVCIGSGNYYSANCVDHSEVEGSGDTYTDAYLRGRPSSFVQLRDVYDDLVWFEVGTPAHEDRLAELAAEAEELESEKEDA